MTNVKYPVEVLIEALDAQATWVPSGPAGVMHRASDMLRTIPYLHSEISRHLARTAELTEYSRKLEAERDALRAEVAEQVRLSQATEREAEINEDGACPCGADGGTSCGSVNCEMISQRRESGINWIIGYDGLMSPNRSYSGYSSVVGKTPFGDIIISWKNWKYPEMATVDEFPGGNFDCHDTPENVRAACEAEFIRRCDIIYNLQNP